VLITGAAAPIIRAIRVFFVTGYKRLWKERWF